MVIFIFTEKGKETLRSFGSEDQERILKKLEVLKQHPDIFSVLIHLHNLPPATHRLRVGPFRLLLRLDSQEKSKTTFRVMKVGNRKNIYL